MYPQNSLLSYVWRCPKINLRTLSYAKIPPRPPWDIAGYLKLVTVLGLLIVATLVLQAAVRSWLKWSCMEPYMWRNYCTCDKQGCTNQPTNKCGNIKQSLDQQATCFAHSRLVKKTRIVLSELYWLPQLQLKSSSRQVSRPYNRDFVSG